MAYDLYPAVDENYDFPPEVRAALAKSAELRQVATQMTTVERNNLTGADLWDGRLILNITEDRVQRYDAASGTWQTLAEQLDAIVPMTEASRDNLSGVELFDGRLILNTTTNRINRYDEATSTWTVVLEVNDLSLVLATTGTPQPTNTAGSLGTSDKAARADHVHQISGGALGSSYVVGSFTTTGTTPTVISSSLAVTFTVPPSGVVLATLSGYAEAKSATSWGNQTYWALYNGASVKGSGASVAYTDTYKAFSTVTWRIAGLTPGSTVTLTPHHYSSDPERDAISGTTQTALRLVIEAG